MRTLGVDIGGTKTAIGIVDTKRGKVVDLHIMPSKKYKNDSGLLVPFSFKKNCAKLFIYLIH